jgi:hypothetical protein
MPLRNRVTPFGEVLALEARGTFMGNRGGCFHTPKKTLTSRRWVSRRWIVCVLEFRGRRREVMAPGRYTELFFLDEATALAAGHRPCRECRRLAHEAFKEAWLRGNADLQLPADVRIDEVDKVLHAQRVGAPKTFRAKLGELPEGTFVTREEDLRRAWLLAGGSLREWTPAGYGGRAPADPDALVGVLTPRSTVRALAAGYEPVLHDSLVFG